MANYTDANDVFNLVGGMFGTVVEMPQIVEGTKDSGLTVRLIVTDPDCEMVVDFPGRKVFLGAAADGVDSSVQLTLTGENANRFWQGKLNFTLAMAQRKVKLEGSRSTALKLMPLTAPIFEQYRTVLKAQGRDDLLLP